jgi:hypothetical protein
MKKQKTKLEIPADLSIPAVLDRTKGRSRQDIVAERERLIARDKQRDRVQHRILTGDTGHSVPRITELNVADKKAIAELQSGEAQRAEAKTATRIAKLKAKKSGESTAMPVSGKAALTLIAQKATKEFIANGGKVTKVEPENKQEPKMKSRQNGKAKVAKSTKRSSGGGLTAKLVEALRGKGCTAAEALKITGWAQISIPPIIRRAGFKVKKTERNGVTCYHAV